MMRRTTRVLAGVAGVTLLLGACGSSKSNTSSGNTSGGHASSSTTAAPSGGSGNGGNSGGSSGNPKTAQNLSQAGGMSALVAAAKKEGHLNVITLPSDWANYGAIMKDFTAKYGIKITDENPDGSSQDEINAAKSLKGTSRAPDVFDMGTAFAATAAADGLLAPYKVVNWKDIPANLKDANGDYYGDYGGYVAIGYDPAKVKTPPTSLVDLLKPAYKGQVGINGNPTEAGAAEAAVIAAALANGGSLNNVAPGVAWFKKLNSEGNFVPVTGSETTAASGQTPILIWWDYLQASEVASHFKSWKILIPSDVHYAAYYDQAISASAPNPAAARLWEEYLYSTTGQNLWLQGGTRPVELPTMIKSGTVDKAALAKLPKAPSTTSLATVAQLTKAGNVIAQQWSQVGAS